MTSDKRHSITPWTPGPWQIVNYRYNQNVNGGRWSSASIVAGDLFDPEDPDPCDIIADTNDLAVEADAELIALAPRMAEAILAWNNCPHQQRYSIRLACGKCNEVLEALAAELRAIGKDNA